MPDAGVSYNSNGTQGTSFGASSISLRYLANTDGDADRTLVLVDGHRWVDGTGPRGIRDFVDLNTLPIGMVGNVEVLQDGASAIYGADAIAGVVNIHTRQNVDGLSTSAKFGGSCAATARNMPATSIGARKINNIGPPLLSASYVNDQPVYTSSRSLTQVSLTGGPNNLSTAPASPQGLYVLPGFSTAAAPSPRMRASSPTGFFPAITSPPCPATITTATRKASIMSAQASVMVFIPGTSQITNDSP